MKYTINLTTEENAVLEKMLTEFNKNKLDTFSPESYIVEMVREEIRKAIGKEKEQNIDKIRTVWDSLTDEQKQQIIAIVKG